MNWGTFIFDLTNKIVSLFDTLKDFLFTEFSVFGNTFSMWALVGGVGIIALIIYGLVRG